MENYNHIKRESIYKHKETKIYYYNKFIIDHIFNQYICIRNYIGLKKTLVSYY